VSDTSAVVTAGYGGLRWLVKAVTHRCHPERSEGSPVRI